MTSCLLMTSFSCLLQNKGSTTRLQDSASNSWASLLRSLHREESTTSSVCAEHKSQKWSDAKKTFPSTHVYGFITRNKPALNTETTKPKYYWCGAETTKNQGSLPESKESLKQWWCGWQKKKKKKTFKDHFVCFGMLYFSYFWWSSESIMCLQNLEHTLSFAPGYSALFTQIWILYLSPWFALDWAHCP